MTDKVRQRKCRQCKTLFDRDANVCPECGAAVRRWTKQRVMIMMGWQDPPEPPALEGVAPPPKRKPRVEDKVVKGVKRTGAWGVVIYIAQAAGGCGTMVAKESKEWRELVSGKADAVIERLDRLDGKVTRLTDQSQATHESNERLIKVLALREGLKPLQPAARVDVSPVPGRKR